MGRRIRIMLILLGITALFLAYQNFTAADLEEFKKIKDEKTQLKSTTAEGLFEEYLRNQLPGIRTIERAFDKDTNQHSIGAPGSQAEVALLKSEEKKNSWRTSVINHNTIKMGYDDVDLMCNSTGEIRVNKKISDQAEVEFSRQPASDNQNIMLKYSW